MSILQNLLKNKALARARVQTPTPEVDPVSIYTVLRDNSKQTNASKQNHGGYAVELYINTLFPQAVVSAVWIMDKIWLHASEDLPCSYQEPVLVLNYRKRFLAWNIQRVGEPGAWYNWIAFEMKSETIAYLINYLWSMGWEKLRLPDKLLPGWLKGNIRAWDISHLESEDE